MSTDLARNDQESKGAYIKRMFLHSLPEHERDNWVVDVRKDTNNLTKVTVRRILRIREAGSTAVDLDPA